MIQSNASTGLCTLEIKLGPLLAGFPTALCSQDSPHNMNGKGPTETVELISEDEQSFIVDARCISLIGIFRPTILAAGAVPPSLSMSTIKSPVLAKLIEWMEAHREDAAASPASASATSHIAGNQSDDELRSSESEFEEILDDDAATQHTDAALDDLASGKRHILREHMQFEEGSMQFAAALGPWDRKFFQALDLGTLIELTKVCRCHLC